MDPKHLIKALAIAYLEEHGGRVTMSKDRLLELTRKGDIEAQSRHDNTIWWFYLKDR